MKKKIEFFFLVLILPKYSESAQKCSNFWHIYYISLKHPNKYFLHSNNTGIMTSLQGFPCMPLVHFWRCSWITLILCSAPYCIVSFLQSGVNFINYVQKIPKWVQLNPLYAFSCNEFLSLEVCQQYRVALQCVSAFDFALNLGLNFNGSCYF